METTMATALFHYYVENHTVFKEMHNRVHHWWQKHNMNTIKISEEATAAEAQRVARHLNRLAGNS